MDAVALFLLTIAGIFLIGVTGEVIFRRTGVPDVVWLVLAGIVIGPVTGAVPREQLAALAPYFAALTLVVILFDGGIRLRLGELSRAAARSGLLALATFAAAVVVVALVSLGARAVGWLPAAWTWVHALMLGAILGGSSSIIIMPAMLQAKVEPRLANLLNLESSFTDALCVVGTTALMRFILAGPGGDTSPFLAIAKAFGIGLLIGSAAGGLWLLLLRWLRARDHAYPVTLSALLILYVVIQNAGGSAALGILAFAVIVGNASVIGSSVGMEPGLDLGTDVRGVHGQIAFIIKSFFFTFIGAMLGPPWSLLALGVLLGVALIAARVPPVRLVTLGGAFSPADRDLIAIGFPRGMAAGVLATMPAAAGVAATEQLSTIVFACVLTTILIFSIGFPIVRRRRETAPVAAESAGAGGVAPAEAGATAAGGPGVPPM